MLNALIQLFERDIQRVADEITSFNDEENLWRTSGEISNSAGTLALHLIGNLNHFIGAQLGKTGYVRDRQAEFNDRNVPRSKIIDDLKNTREMVLATLKTVEDSNLDQPFPIEVFGGMSTREFLIHLYGHLNYHLGQMNYLRRTLES